MSYLSLNNVNKIYDNGFHSVKNLNLEINEGDFLVLVGPSGCSKSTILRIIAGLEEVTSGEVIIDNKVVNNVAPKDRNIAMVFQDYALYPHMSIYDNISFGLKLKKVAKDIIDKEVNIVAKNLEIEHILDRKPRQLSGGQRQRVALARALVKNPKIFLLDEPLSNLDAKLRVHTRAKISELHKSLSKTMVYVTHDQVEAMTMGNKVCVLKEGKVMQMGDPLDLYKYPKNRFVASFIGSPAMNTILGKLVKENNDYFFITDNFKIKIPETKMKHLFAYLNKEVYFGIRPSQIFLHNQDLKDFYAESKANAILVEKTGSQTFLHFFINNDSMVAKINTSEAQGIKINDQINLYFNMEESHFFDSVTEENITLNYITGADVK